MPDPTHLTAEKIAQLLHASDLARRVDLAERVARAFDPATLSAAERDSAEMIFRQMLRDAETRVRQALSHHLRHNPAVPKDVASALARDVAEVAEPILEHSAVFTDDDLIDIVSSQSDSHQTAVARRRGLSASVAQAIAETGAEPAVAALMGNPGAEITDAAFGRALDRFPRSEAVAEPMVARANLPLALAERLVTLVSDRLRQRLVIEHDLPPDVAADLVLQTRERATVGLTAEARRYDLPALVRQLAEHRRLTPTLILRALCTGHLDFFETALALRAGIPVANVHILLHDRGPGGLASLHRHCGLPEPLFPIMRAALDVARELEFTGEPGDRDRFAARIIERLMTSVGDDFSSDDLGYLIGRLSGDAA